jgi:hypothetical protein
MPTAAWRSPETAERLARLDRAGFAAEFLRRNPDYQRDFRRTARAIASGRLAPDEAAAGLARRWGCLRAPDPDAPDGSEQTYWLPQVSPETLVLDIAPADLGQPPPLDLEVLGRVTTDTRHDGRRHLALADPYGDIRLTLASDDALARPAAIVPLDAGFELRIAALQRLARRRGGRSPAAPNKTALTPLQRRRLVQLLKAHDIHEAGGGPRDIAAFVVRSSQARLAAVEWKDSAARRMANRLLRDAIGLVGGGYRRLLAGA